MKQVSYITILFFSAVILLTACDKKDNGTTVTGPALEAFLQADPTLSVFNQAMEKAQLQAFKTGGGPYTWYAPTNAAFQAAGISVDAMTAGQLSYILLYHMSPAVVSTKDMVAQSSFARATQIGSTAALAVYLGQLNDSFYVNGSNIISKDNRVANGMVHIINRLNIPPNLRGNIQNMLNTTGQHSLFIAALTRAGRWTALTGGTFTVLAPTDAAMTAAGYTTASIAATPVATMDSVVKYHIFSGSRLFTNDFGNEQTPPTFLSTTKTLLASNNGTKLKGTKNATPVDIILANLLGTNGVVHVINGVLKY